MTPEEKRAGRQGRIATYLDLTRVMLAGTDHEMLAIRDDLTQQEAYERLERLYRVLKMTRDALEEVFAE